ncbi:hypothetical protein HanRHA438_Chr15g0728081 [Helianthus annuus]|nr:hypothetical protein HanRHA438_Chr15g0728081 [Helianthus annuus]
MMTMNDDGGGGSVVAGEDDRRRKTMVKTPKVGDSGRRQTEKTNGEDERNMVVRRDDGGELQVPVKMKECLSKTGTGDEEDIRGDEELMIMTADEVNRGG